MVWGVVSASGMVCSLGLVWKMVWRVVRGVVSAGDGSSGSGLEGGLGFGRGVIPASGLVLHLGVVRWVVWGGSGVWFLQVVR